MLTDQNKIDQENKQMEFHFGEILKLLGENPDREGLLETPKRVTKAWRKWTEGYAMDPSKIMKVFEDGGEDYDQMVLIKNIPVYSHCEHHMAAIIGKATVAYMPNKKIVGLSKINRIVDLFSRRLQVQERLTANIADSLFDELSPKGVGVFITARHMCMESRGVCQQGHHTETTALRGCFEETAVKQEFLMSCQKH